MNDDIMNRKDKIEQQKDEKKLYNSIWMMVYERYNEWYNE